MPYQPVERPKIATESQVEGMLAKLRARHPQACPVSQAVPKASDEAQNDSLRWRKVAENSYESSKGPVLLAAEGKFIVFDRLTTKEHTAQVIGRFNDAQTAKDFVRLLP